jgi:hypothetical protein
MAWTMDSSLKGRSSICRLVGKTAAESVALTVERRINDRDARLMQVMESWPSIRLSDGLPDRRDRGTRAACPGWSRLNPTAAASGFAATSAHSMPMHGCC